MSRKSAFGVTVTPCFALVFPDSISLAQLLPAAREAAVVARVHATRKPVGREFTRDLRALQRDPRHHRARHGPPRSRGVGDLEHPGMELREFEIVLRALFQVAANLRL